MVIVRPVLRFELDEIFRGHLHYFLHKSPQACLTPSILYIIYNFALLGIRAMGAGPARSNAAGLLQTGSTSGYNEPTPAYYPVKMDRFQETSRSHRSAA